MVTQKLMMALAGNSAPKAVALRIKGSYPHVHNVIKLLEENVGEP